MKPVYSVISQNVAKIDDWFVSKLKGLTPPVYSSCDLRHSGQKIAVVDSNLFPAGFNNLCNAFSKDAIAAFESYFTNYHPGVESVLLFIEEHTRNKFYLKNVQRLAALLQSAHKKVIIGMAQLPQKNIEIDLDGESLLIHQIEAGSDGIVANGIRPDIILSNNDLSSGLPDVLKDISQTIVPSPQLGWFNRKKSSHFAVLETVCTEFGKDFDVDPWWMSALFDSSGPVDFDSEVSLNQLAQKAEQLISRIREKYQEHNISETPYIYLKNNSGTYGMGLLPVFSGDEIMTLNRKKKNKLLSSKGSVPVTDYILQEGVPTVDSYSGYPIEPVIYSVGGKDIGGFFRIHPSKNALESLNAPGMTFSCLCLHKLEEPHEKFFIECKEKEKLVVISRFLSRLDALACAREMSPKVL